jgi:2-polyprenyl-3-methyl-5-hydroxy-6-metoxy-1,4-benzoquinol methylase
MSSSSKQLLEIPTGHYHRVMKEGNPIRRTWHLLKFKRVIDALPLGPGLSLIDIGCFAGSLLSLASETQFATQLGVDILPEQIDFANQHFGSAHRRFEVIASLGSLARLPGQFDCATAVEVIEHLRSEEIRQLVLGAAKLLKPSAGVLVLSTPNYASTWPLLEVALNHFSDVDYSEQHITKFTWFNLRRKLVDIVPELNRYFTFDLVTTTHLFTPFAAPLLGVERAMRLSIYVPHARWHIPFGNLLLLRLRRTAASFT